MGAFHPFGGDPRTFAKGTNRGDSLQTRLDVALGETWKAHALYEYFLPGDFYSARADAYFLRFEVSWMMRGAIHAGK